MVTLAVFAMMVHLTTLTCFHQLQKRLVQIENSGPMIDLKLENSGPILKNCIATQAPQLESFTMSKTDRDLLHQKASSNNLSNEKRNGVFVVFQDKTQSVFVFITEII